MRRSTFPCWGRGTVLCTVDEAIAIFANKPITIPIKNGGSKPPPYHSRAAPSMMEGNRGVWGVARYAP